MAVIGVLAVLAGACGGGSEETDPGSATTGSTVDDTASAGGSATTGTTAEPTGNGEDQEDGDPERLEDFLGFSFDDPEANAAFAADMERRVQESIASCMAQEGFEYIPAVRPQDFGFFALDQEDFARERGFGITT